METPVLSSKQVKSSLSAKKKKPRETLKNVLRGPYISYWPYISQEDNEILDKVWMNLPRLRNNINITWEKIKHVPKEERKALRQKIRSEEPISYKETGIIFGVNAVTRLIQNNMASVIMVTDNIKPRQMVRHVMDLSVLHKVPAVVCKNLKSQLDLYCGIKSLVCAITKNLSLESKLNIIKETVETIFSKYPPPRDHLNYNRSADTLKKETSPENKIIKIDNQSKIHEGLFLKKTTDGKRAFHPKEEPSKKDNRIQVDDNLFIGFTEEPQVIENNFKYKPLVVKKLKGDVNRNKRKIESLKNKKIKKKI